MGDDREPGTRDPSDATGTSYRSPFADLLELVDERWERRVGPDQSPDARGDDGTEPRRPEDDPLELVRRLIPDDLPAPRTGSGRRGAAWKLAGGVAVAVVVAVLLPGVVTAPFAVVSDTVFAPEPATYVGSDDVLFVDPEEAAYLNRIYAETTHEVAYCGYVTHDEQTPRVEVVLADTVAAGPDQVSFVTDNCPDVAREVLLHTHPNGVLELSARDRRTLAARPERFMCVQGGQLATEPGRHVTDLACYRQAQPDDVGAGLGRVQVFVAPG